MHKVMMVIPLTLFRAFLIAAWQSKLSSASNGMSHKKHDM